MSDPSASTEPVVADPELPPSDASGPGGKDSRKSGTVAALVAGVLVGMFVGVGIGMGIGNAARKRLDRWSPRY